MPGHDGICGFWFKKCTFIHNRLALDVNKCLQGARVPEWMTKGNITLIEQDPNKRTARNNNRRITCLLMMWKISTAQKRFTTLEQVADCSLRNRKYAAKNPVSKQSYIT